MTLISEKQAKRFEEWPSMWVLTGFGLSVGIPQRRCHVLLGESPELSAEMLTLTRPPCPVIP